MDGFSGSKTKYRIIEIPDMNEEIPTLRPGGSSTDTKEVSTNVDMNEEIPIFLPEGSSTNSKEVSTSRVNSLDAEYLFPVGEHPSRPDFSLERDPPHDNNDQNNRWMKRLRVSYSNEYSVGTRNSDIGEPSAHKKYGEFFNKTMKTETDNEYPPSCLIGGNENLDHSCPWVQRWWKDSTFASNLSLKKVDPHVSVDEMGKRQFPSIGAMALMGKTMNGFRSCEIEKKGSVFVWNTKE